MWVDHYMTLDNWSRWSFVNWCYKSVSGSDCNQKEHKFWRDLQKDKHHSNQVNRGHKYKEVILIIQVNIWSRAAVHWLIKQFMEAAVILTCLHSALWQDALFQIKSHSFYYLRGLLGLSVTVTGMLCNIMLFIGQSLYTLHSTFWTATMNLQVYCFWSKRSHIMLIFILSYI